MAIETIPPKDICILVTGGARGIGAATARLLAEGGAQVMIADVLDDEGEALAESLGDRVVYRHLDVTREADWRAAVDEAVKRFGRLNAVFNNAGILAVAGVEDCAPDEFRKVIDVNLFSVFLGLHVAAPAMRKSGGGVIVNTSSTAGLQGYGSLAAYVSSKWGVRGLTKAAALDLAGEGIRVVSVHPGPVATPMTKDFSDETVANQPMPRFGEPEEVARMVRFIVSEATFSTGSEFTVDGGAVTGQVLPLHD
ncbi:SDR family oxidoreductase [Henriciella sp.]|uniref:SDR family oxidoreductase n=1 Tax=Henriciella sp. TaxID=1968823 RepID=UPI00262E2E1B|nr:SDR family oxidoreductase [Henriciella sp.]